MTGNGQSTVGTTAVGAQAVLEDPVPVPPDQGSATAGAPGGITVGIVDVPDVDVAQAAAHRDAARPRQRGRRSARYVPQVVGRMEGGEVEGYVGAEFGCDPGGESVDLRSGVVVARDQQRGQLQPHRRLVGEVADRVEHRLEM